MALGAERQRIFQSIVAEALLLLAGGVVAGVPLGFAAAKVLSDRLPGFNADEPTVFAFVALLLIGAGVASAAIPASRAAKVNPSEALRAE